MHGFRAQIRVCRRDVDIDLDIHYGAVVDRGGRGVWAVDVVVAVGEVVGERARHVWRAARDGHGRVTEDFGGRGRFRETRDPNMG